MIIDYFFMAFDIVMFGMSRFGDFEHGVNNRNRCVLEGLRKHPAVGTILFVDFAPFNAKTALKTFTQAKMYKSFSLRKIRKIDESLFVYSSMDFLISPERLLLDLRREIARLDMGKQNALLLWSYDPLTIRSWENIQCGMRIFDTVDNWMSHGNFVSYKERLQKNYDSIGNKADIIFTVSRSVCSLFPNAKNIHWIPNGIDLELFDFHKQQNPPHDMFGIPRPISGYVGIIQDRVDFALMDQLAKANPDISWVFIGPVWPTFLKSVRPKAPEIANLQKNPNVYFLGAKPYSDIPSYVRQFDVAIIPHKINDLTQSMNPLKMYEYLSLGKPVVSTPVAGLEKFKEHIALASDADAFRDMIKDTLIHNTKEKQEERVRSVREESWNKRIEDMIRIISKRVQ